MITPKENERALQLLDSHYYAASFLSGRHKLAARCKGLVEADRFLASVEDSEVKAGPRCTCAFPCGGTEPGCPTSWGYREPPYAFWDERKALIVLVHKEGRLLLSHTQWKSLVNTDFNTHRRW